MDHISYDSTAFASSDDPDAQRGGSRDSLLLSAQLKLVGLSPVTVRVRNLSSGGLMAEYVGRANIGDVAEVELRGIGQITGRIAWVAEGRLGIAFDREIDPMMARKPVAVPKRSTAPAKRRIL